MSDNKVFNVFIASSGDITLERKIVNEICSGIGDCVLPNPKGISFRVTLWEHVFSGSETVREITKKLADECDILVCILFKRFRCIVDRTGPDPLKEFLLAYDSWKSIEKPQMLFYFKEIKETDPVDHRLENVLALKKKLKHDGLFFYEDFSAPQEFCERMHDQIMECIEVLK